MAGMEPIEGTEEAFTSNDNDILTEWITRTIDLADGSGDVKIILRYGPRKKNKLQELLVSSDAMARASPVWRKMFTGGWAETKADRLLVLDHTEDSYKAVVTIMNIIHLRFSDVPPTVTLAGLKAIATFTDQRMATALVVPWIERWLSHLSGSVDTVGCETEWLWIAWEFGLAAVFDRISRRLAYGAPVPVAEPSPPPSTFGNFGRTGARAFSPAAEEHGDVFNDVNFDNLPPEVEDVVKGARLAMVGRMLTEVYDYFDALLQWTGSPKASLSNVIGHACRHCDYRTARTDLVSRHVLQTHGFKNARKADGWQRDHIRSGLSLQSWSQNGPRGYWIAQPAAATPLQEPGRGAADNPLYGDKLDAPHRLGRDVWLADGSHTPFSAIIRMMAYGKGHRRREGERPRVMWEGSSRALRYLGQQITIEAFQKAARKTLTTAEATMEELLRGGWAEAHEAMTLDRIVDTALFEGAGQSFATNEANSWLRPGPQRLAELCRGSLWDARLEQWRQDGVLGWLAKVESLKRSLRETSRHSWWYIYVLISMSKPATLSRETTMAS
ncbi:nuclear pore protein [Colletotrichum tabaci]|uniref:Nuclear pore protein n=1 Tax=Colletotrichum tabaci TaxID=1209068 RepID=A0AAV9SSF2_9PEZI